MEIETVLFDNGRKTEEYVREYFIGKDAPELIKSAISYSFFSGGKRIRPSLVIECGKTFGVDEMSLLPFAASVEMIHTYSLIHDDLPSMDNDDIRRGRPSNHKVFGEAQAILAGDALLNLSFEILMDKTDFTKPYITAAGYLYQKTGICGMIGGQSLDMSTSDKRCDFTNLKKMHMMKTGALINACCICPALLAQSEDTVLSAIGRYADDLGLIFQITDDILDFTGSAKELGKTAGKDQSQNKQTYITVYGHEKTLEILNDRHESAITALDDIKADTSFLKEFAGFIKNRNH